MSQSQSPPHLRRAVHNIFARTHQHCPQQSFSGLQPHFRRSWHISDADGRRVQPGSQVSNLKPNPSHPDMAEQEMPQKIVPTDILLGMLTASHVGSMKQRWVEWTLVNKSFLATKTVEHSLALSYISRPTLRRSVCGITSFSTFWL